jgi:small ligand-binding sensory domain FIST
MMSGKGVNSINKEGPIMSNKMLQEAQMLFCSAMTTTSHVKEATQELVEQIIEQMGGQTVDFLQLFMTPHFRIMATPILEYLQAELKPRVVIGCSGESVISRTQEIEGQAAMVVVAAHLPQVQVVPFKLQSMNWSETLGQVETFYEIINAPEQTKLFVLLSDPYTTPMDQVLKAFNTFYPGLPLIGGLASGSHRPGGNVLLYNDEILNHGAVGVAFAGALEVDLIVSQGCRPVGHPLTITEARENIILSLEGLGPVTHLQQLFSELSDQDQALLQNGLYIGRVINPDQKSWGRGDFLIRGVMGIDRENGSLIVGDYMQAGELIQFHLRDALTAEEDLEMMLTPQALRDASAHRKPQGSCGRFRLLPGSCGVSRRGRLVFAA